MITFFRGLRIVLAAIGAAWLLAHLLACGGEEFTTASALEVRPAAAVDGGELLEDLGSAGAGDAAPEPDADVEVLVDASADVEVLVDASADVEVLVDASADVEVGVDAGSTSPKTCSNAAACPACVAESPCCSLTHLCGCLVAGTYCQ